VVYIEQSNLFCKVRTSSEHRLKSARECDRRRSSIKAIPVTNVGQPGLRVLVFWLWNTNTQLCLNCLRLSDPFKFNPPYKTENLTTLKLHCLIEMDVKVGFGAMSNIHKLEQHIGVSIRELTL